MNKRGEMMEHEDREKQKTRSMNIISMLNNYDSVSVISSGYKRYMDVIDIVEFFKLQLQYIGL